MAGRYGISFAKVHIEKGEYEEAVTAATAEIDGGNAGPEPFFDRATARELLEEFDGSLADFEAAIARTRETKEMDGFQLDDAYFSALVAAAQAAASPALGIRALDRYLGTSPDGTHRGEVEEWKARLKGDRPTLLDKTVDM